MATLEGLRRQLESTEALQSVVRTMKALAAVNIRQYEDAVASLKDYRRAVELGLQVVLRQAQTRRPASGQGSGPAALIVIGSDQGMCGQFNEVVTRHALRTLRKDARQRWLVLGFGEKATAALEAEGRDVTVQRSVPGSADAITAHVRGVLSTVDHWQEEHGTLARIVLVRNAYTEQAFAPTEQTLLPMDEAWLQEIRQRRWPTHVLPMFSAAADDVLSHLVRQYLFIELHGALAESLAAENATRLRAMQSAEKNVDERLDELSARYHRQRQNSITAELLDVISGSEAVG